MSTREWEQRSKNLFPLFVKKIIKDLDSVADFEIRPVNYRFRKGENQMTKSKKIIFMTLYADNETFVYLDVNWKSNGNTMLDKWKGRWMKKNGLWTPEDNFKIDAQYQNGQILPQNLNIISQIK